MTLQYCKVTNSVQISPIFHQDLADVSCSLESPACASCNSHKNEEHTSSASFAKYTLGCTIPDMASLCLQLSAQFPHLPCPRPWQNARTLPFHGGSAAVTALAPTFSTTPAQTSRGQTYAVRLRTVSSRYLPIGPLKTPELPFPFSWLLSFLLALFMPEHLLYSARIGSFSRGSSVILRAVQALQLSSPQPGSDTLSKSKSADH